MKPILENEEFGVKELLQLPTAEEMGSSYLWATLPTLCVTPEDLIQSAGGQGTLPWQRKETQNEIFKSSGVFWCPNSENPGQV